MSAQQPKVLVQLANGDSLENEDQIASEQIAGQLNDFSAGPISGVEETEEGGSVSFGSPPSAVLASANGADEDDVDVLNTSATDSSHQLSARRGEGSGDRIHPPSSPSPPPSMTPPDHLHMAQHLPSSHMTSSISSAYHPRMGNHISSSSSVGHVIHHNSRTGRPIAPAPPPPPSHSHLVSTVVLGAPSPNTHTIVASPASLSSGHTSVSTSAALAGGPAVIVGTPAGQSPSHAAVQSDHCYGLPYQDHNYGGPVVPSGPMQLGTSSSGRPPYPFKVRYPAGLRSLQMRDRSSTLSSDGDAPENFPVIGGLERYLNDEATEPETSPAPCATGVMSRTVAGDGIAITTYRGTGGNAAPPPLNATPSSNSVPYYQRYITPVEYAAGNIQPNSPAYSQHLVQIGGRTYIRQTTGPPPAPAGVGSGLVFRNRQDYMGVNNPPVLIPPYGGRGRGGQKRVGRPRLPRSVVASSTGNLSSNIAGGLTPSSFNTSATHMPGTDPGPAPMIAPSKGGRPPGRGRGGARRRGGISSITNTIAGLTTTTSPSQLNNSMKSPEDERQEKDALAGLLSDYEKRYDELLNRPLAGSGTTAAPTTVTTPRSTRGRGARPPRPTTLAANKRPTPNKPNITNSVPIQAQQPLSPDSDRILTPPLLPKVTVEPIPEGNGYVSQRIQESPDVGPMTALTAPPEEEEPIPAPPKKEEELDESQSDSESSRIESETSSTDTDTEGEWAGTDYITRCICGMQHNDEFMISCDKCDVWQHCLCMGIDTKRVPDAYMCEKCNERPLKLTAEKAREIQVKKLEKRAKEKERRRQQRQKRRERRMKMKAKRKLEAQKQSKDMMLPKQKAMDTYHELNANDYTEEAKRFIQLQGDTLGYNLLEQISESVCQAMYVAPGKWGLVTARTVPPNQPVAEYRGRVCLKSECSGKDKLGRVMTYTIIYSGFPILAGQMDASGGHDTICIDARLKGSPARFVRRSCRPNTQVKHVIKAGQLHLLLVSTELVERGTEVTIPFDFDFRSSRYAVDCACPPALPLGSPLKDGVSSPGVMAELEENPCPIQEHNRDLEAKKKAEQEKRKSVTMDIKRKRPTSSAVLKKNVKNARRRKQVGSGAGKKKAVVGGNKGGRKKAVAGKKTGGGGGGLKVKFSTDRAKSAVQKAKNGPKMPIRSLPARKRPMPPSKEEMVVKKEETPTADGDRKDSKATPNELKALKRDFWNKDSDKKSSSKGRQSGRTRSSVDGDYTISAAPATDNQSTPPDNNKPLSREERKLQALMNQIQKSEEKEKKKEDVKAKESDKVEIKSGKWNQKVSKSTPTSVGKKKKRMGKWKKGQEKSRRSAKKKQKKKETKTTRSSRRRSPSRSESESAEEEEDEDGSAGGASGGASSGPTTRHSAAGGAGGSTGGGSKGGSGKIGNTPNSRAPPRKRWASSSTGVTPQIAEDTVISPVPQVRAAGTPPSGGTKKRWLRQAMSEDQQEAAKETSGVASPLKKRLRTTQEKEEEDNGAGITTAEAAALLTRMGQANTEEGGGVENGVVDETPASPEPVLPAPQPLFSTLDSIPTIPVDEEMELKSVVPEPVKKRKKMSLDEYKKRKGVAVSVSSDQLDVQGGACPPMSAPPGVSGPNFGATGPQSQSFIPQMTETEILASGRSFKLGNLPDPSQLGRGTATIEDLKQRIYGRKFIDDQPQQPPKENPPTRPAVESPPPPPPPARKPEKSAPETRMSLAERLRMEFGLEPEPEPQPEPQPQQQQQHMVSKPPMYNNSSAAMGAYHPPGAPRPMGKPLGPPGIPGVPFNVSAGLSRTLEVLSGIRSRDPWTEGPSLTAQSGHSPSVGRGVADSTQYPACEGEMVNGAGERGEAEGSRSGEETWSSEEEGAEREKKAGSEEGEICSGEEEQEERKKKKPSKRRRSRSPNELPQKRMRRPPPPPEGYAPSRHYAPRHGLRN